MLGVEYKFYDEGKVGWRRDGEEGEGWMVWIK